MEAPASLAGGLAFIASDRNRGQKVGPDFPPYFKCLTNTSNG